MSLCMEQICCMLTFKSGPLQLYLLDPQLWLERSYESGSVHPSVQKFSWDWLISFFLKLSMMLGAHVRGA